MKKVIGVMLFCALIFGSVTPALAELGIVPTQILFEERERFKDVTLFNPGNETKSYDVSWEFYRMIGGDSDLAYEPVSDSITDFNLANYIVFSPRRVTLPPKGRQKVRLALRRPGDVPEGEYRAHLKFSPVREDDGPEKQVVEGFSAALNIRVGFSIPVVFQVGGLDAQAKIEGLSFNRNPQNGVLEAYLDVSRQGKHGALGYIEVLDENGEEIGRVANAHIFPEVSSRRFKIVLNEEKISGKNIRVIYRHYMKEKGIVYSEKIFPIQR